MVVKCVIMKDKRLYKIDAMRSFLMLLVILWRDAPYIKNWKNTPIYWSKNLSCVFFFKVIIR